MTRPVAQLNILIGCSLSSVGQEQESSVSWVEPFLALVAVFAFFTVVVVLGEGFEEGFVIAIVVDLPVKGPEHVVKDVLHAVVAFKHHFLNLLRLPTLDDELPLGEERAVAEVIEEANQILDAVHDVDDFKQFGNVFITNVLVHERQLEEGAVLVGFKHAFGVTSLVLKFVDVAPFLTVTGLHERCIRS